MKNWGRKKKPREVIFQHCCEQPIKNIPTPGPNNTLRGTIRQGRVQGYSKGHNIGPENSLSTASLLECETVYTDCTDATYFWMTPGQISDIFPLIPYTGPSFIYRPVVWVPSIENRLMCSSITSWTNSITLKLLAFISSQPDACGAMNRSQGKALKEKNYLQSHYDAV